jgi:hypothetical protein
MLHQPRAGSFTWASYEAVKGILIRSTIVRSLTETVLLGDKLSPDVG